MLFRYEILKNKWVSNLSSFVLLFLFTFLLCGCVETPNPPPPPKKNVVIKNLNLIIESSESMKGFLAGGTEFQGTASDMAAFFDECEKKSLVVNDQYFSTDNTNIIPISDDAGTFIRLIKDGNVATGTNTPLDKFFKDIINLCDSTSIYGIISDFIYSPQNPSNLSQMSAEFQTIFNVAKQKGLTFSIYQYYSKFNGKYWDKTGKIHHLIKQTRPYYIWFIGPENLMRLINDLILNEPQFRNGNQIHLGFNYDKVNWTVFDESTKLMDGSFLFEYGRINIMGSDSVLIPIGIGMSKLPYYFAGKQYLSKNLKIASKNGGRIIINKIMDKMDYEAKLTDSDKQKALNLNAPAIIQIKAVPASEESYYILSLEKSMPNWFYDISSDDDTQIEQANRGKTFAFQYLVEGAIKALEDPNPVFKINLIVNK